MSEVTISDLRVWVAHTDFPHSTVDPMHYDLRLATVADLVPVLRQEGFLVIGKDDSGKWPKWAVPEPGVNSAYEVLLDALLEAQPKDGE